MKKNTSAGSVPRAESRGDPFRLFGILGFPLSHTLSPILQEAAFSKQGIRAFYLALELDLPYFKKAMKGLSSRFLLEGFNVTVPYKETVIPYLDGFTEEARAIGAVNTVFRRSGKWIGANTDALGFEMALEKEGRFLMRGKKVLVLGAGGSARAVIYALARKGANEIQIANRRPARARKILRDFKPLFPKARFQTLSFKEKNLKTVLREADLVVNATPVGLKAGDRPLFPSGFIPSKKEGKVLFFDLIYRPKETVFLAVARRRGQKGMGGAPMLLYQGAKSFEYWTGQEAPIPVMREALNRALAEN